MCLKSTVKTPEQRQCCRNPRQASLMYKKTLKNPIKLKIDMFYHTNSTLRHTFCWISAHESLSAKFRNIKCYLSH